MALITDIVAGNGYLMLCNTSSCRIFTLVAGSLSSLVYTVPAISPAASELWQLRKTDNAGGYEVFQDSVSVGSFVDVTYSGDVYGACYARTTTGFLDSVETSVEGGGTSVAQTDDTPEDGVEQTVTCTGMTGPITSVTLGGVAVTPSSTDPSSPFTYTYNISAQAIETNQPQPRLGIPVDLVVTTATDGAVSTSVTIQTKTGWALTEFADPLDKVANGYAATIETAESITITSADASYYDTASTASIATDTIYTSGLTLPGEFTKSILQVGGTSPATSYSDNFYPYGTGGATAPVLASTKALSGIIDQAFSKTLTIQSGDPATSWTITGGADQAEYSLKQLQAH